MSSSVRGESIPSGTGTDDFKYHQYLCYAPLKDMLTCMFGPDILYNVVFLKVLCCIHLNSTQLD